MAPYSIRMFGDPVLKQRAAEVTDIDGRLARLADDMLTTMYDAPGLGLAAPQVGVQKRFFVYDIGDGPRTLDQPGRSASRGASGSTTRAASRCPACPSRSCGPKEIHLVGLRPRRQRGLDRGRRAARPTVPARARPPRRRAAARAPRRRPAQGGHEGAASSHRPGASSRRRSTAPRPVAPRAASCPLPFPRLPAVSPSSARPTSPPAVAGARRRRLRGRAGRTRADKRRGRGGRARAEPGEGRRRSSSACP